MLFIATLWYKIILQIATYPAGIVSSLILTLSILIFGILQINYGIIKIKDNDVSLDMYGWEELNKEFSRIDSADKVKGIMKGNAPIVTFRWSLPDIWIII